MWLLVCLCIFLRFSFADVPRASTPDIYPSNRSAKVGNVRVVLVQNQPAAWLFFTTDGTNPTNLSTEYLEPIDLFHAGGKGASTQTVKAMAVSKLGDLADSVVAERTYTILAGVLPAPTAFPKGGGGARYRGSVRVALYTTVEGGTLQYALNDEDPGDAWQPYSSPIVLDTPRDFLITARVIKGSDFSPMAAFRFRVEPPLQYDVSTECAKCDNEPTVGKPFTLWLQNAEVGSTIALSTSIRGCSGKEVKHRIDDLPLLTTTLRRVSYRYTTQIEPYPKVYVCINEPSNGTFLIVPRRLATKVTGMDPFAFAIEPAIGALKAAEVVIDETQAPFIAGSAAGSTVVYGVTFGFLALAVFFVVVFVSRIFRYHPLET